MRSGPGDPKGRGAIACAVLGAAATLGLLLAASAGPIGLYNVTPSEPMGWYWRTNRPVGRGQLAAFRPPAAARAFLPARAPSSFLKTVAAGPGDDICASKDTLFINGAPRAAILRADRRGRVLPHWSGCRRLGRDLWLMISDRVPNSFDSRYFGPVSGEDILGVYAPLLGWSGRASP